MADDEKPPEEPVTPAPDAAPPWPAPVLTAARLSRGAQWIRSR